MFIKPEHKRKQPKTMEAYTKPKPKHSKQNIPKPHPDDPKYVRTKQMAQSGLDQLSRDYVIEHKKLEFLSLDYVIEHGKEFGENLWWDRCYGYFICDLSEDKEDYDEDVYYTGLSYEVYGNGKLAYYEYYENGVQEGEEVEFYFSGELKSYAVWHNGKTLEISYGWFENGMIKWYNNGKQLIRFDEEGYMYRKAERK